MAIANSNNTTSVEYVTTVDGLVAGVTPFFTTLAGAGNFQTSQILVSLESVGGVVTGGATFSIGTNAPTYDNIDNGDLLGPAFSNAGDYMFGSLSPTAINISVPPSTAVSFNLQIAEPTATTFDLRIKLIGYYL